MVNFVVAQSLYYTCQVIGCYIKRSWPTPLLKSKNQQMVKNGATLNKKAVKKWQFLFLLADKNNNW